MLNPRFSARVKKLAWILIVSVGLLLVAFGVHHKMNQSHVSVPAKAEDILNETEKHLHQLTASVQSQNAKQVHQHDVAIRKLIARIPEHAAADTKKNVNALVKAISDASKTAHKLAHDDAWTEAAAQVKQAQAALAKLKASFKEIPQ